MSLHSEGTNFTRRSMLNYMAGALAACPACLSVASGLAAEKGVPWSYDGDTGPEKWGELSADNRICSSGVQQSPIDLRAAIPADSGKIRFDYKPTTLRVLNNGHTIECVIDPGSGMTLDGRNYRLLQFHFHHPSEHAMDGRRFDMEAHFVHGSDDGSLAVLGVFIEPGDENDLLAPIWTHMPRSAGLEKEVASTVIEPVRLLPSNRRYFRYLGSLTTPPCSQTVIWSVFSQPVQASKAQIEQFAGLFEMNARPLQRLGRRLLLKSN